MQDFEQKNNTSQKRRRMAEYDQMKLVRSKTTLESDFSLKNLQYLQGQDTHQNMHEQNSAVFTSHPGITSYDPQLPYPNESDTSSLEDRENLVAS
jgi:hypothetical protein